MADKQYKVTLPYDFPAPRRHRAGVEILAGPDGYVGSLTDEQLNAIREDSMLTVEDVKGSENPEEAQSEPQGTVKRRRSKK